MFLTTAAGYLWLDTDDTLHDALVRGKGYHHEIAKLQGRHDLTIKEMAEYIYEEHPHALSGIKKLWADPNYQLTQLDKALIRMTLDGEQKAK